MLSGLIEHVTRNGGVDWQEYGPAIRRWEQIHGPVPFPATLGPKNGIKPAPLFVEWMMALPAGHVDSVPGLTVNDKLRLLGNGVVPGQAESAIRELTQGNEEVMFTTDTSSFFTTHQTRDVPRDRWGRYKLPGPDGPETSWTRATTVAATIAEQYGLSIWHQRQVVLGMARRPDLLALAQTISGPEDKQALSDIVKEAHIAAGTQAKANRGTTIHRAIEAAERGAFEQVPENLRDLVRKYFETLAEYRLEILPEYIERTVIVPEYGSAGTFDNLFRCADGKIRVGDKKTGRLDYSDVEFAIQMSQYANASAIFNYATGQYEPMPDVAKDYAILIEIDPETGNSVPKRINIAWGWSWMRTCAEVMDIRKTKHIITPYIRPEPKERDTTWAPVLPGRRIEGPPATHVLPENVTEFTMNSNHPTVSGVLLTSVPGGYVDSTSDVSSEFQAFWSDSRHYEDDTPEQINGVPVADYGKPSTWPCARNEPCEVTGSDGLHTDGTVCLYGNARPGPITALDRAMTTVTEHTGATVDEPPEVHADIPAAVAEGQNPDATPQSVMAAAGAPISESNVDALIAAIDGLKGGKAAVQTVARRLMSKLDIAEGDPGAIKLNQYKIKIANAIVDLAYIHGASIPGQRDGDQDFGTPNGPAPTNSAPGTKPSAKKAEGERSAVEADKGREAMVRVAVESIRSATSIETIQRYHDTYSAAPLGWTDEMQNAARTRAAELDAVAGEVPLTPMQMIEGATSKATLTKAWQKATENGANKGGWTEEMNSAAIAKNAELSAVATSSSNQ